MFDIVIRNGMLIDGTGNRRRCADVGITAGKIAAVDSLAEAEAVMAGAECNVATRPSGPLPEACIAAKNESQALAAVAACPSSSWRPAP